MTKNNIHMSNIYFFNSALYCFLWILQINISVEFTFINAPREREDKKMNQANTRNEFRKNE